jgi:hypothetical protein
LTSSRLLIVEVNEKKKVAKIVWEYTTGEYTPEYGENDRLPSGNLLTTFWLSKYNVTQWASRSASESQFDMRVEEVVRSTKLPAWRVSAQGAICDDGVCSEKKTGTWMAYSAERFYVRPSLTFASLSRRKNVVRLTVSRRKQSRLPRGPRRQSPPRAAVCG